MPSCPAAWVLSSTTAASGQSDLFSNQTSQHLIKLRGPLFRVVCLEVPREKVSLRDFFHMGSRASSPSEIKYRLSIEHLRDKLLRLRDLGCLKHCLEIDTRDFNKLEFLGDTVLQVGSNSSAYPPPTTSLLILLVLCFGLQYEATIRIWQSYGCFHGADGLTNKRSDTVRNLTLACVFEDLGFDKDWMRKPPDKWDRASWKPMADALEAIIGELHVLSMSPGVELSAEIPLARECISSIVEACRDRGERLRDPSEISSILISVTHLNSKTT